MRRRQFMISVISVCLLAFVIRLSQHDPHYVHAPRSSHWPAVRAHFLKNEYLTDDGWTKFTDKVDRSCCLCCGSRFDLQVHHIEPFHLDPNKELSPENLVTLCRDHHFQVGHLRNWKKSNPNVCTDCEAMRTSRSRPK